MMIRKTPSQAYHLVQPRPWPLFTSISVTGLVVSFVSWIHIKVWWWVPVSGLILMFVIFLWWRDITREGLLGCHTLKVRHGLEVGIVLFILSEVMFFFSFFWAFFHRRLAPTPEIGCVWPPVGIVPLNPWGVPLLNTVVLLSSGVTVTWAHHALLRQNKVEVLQALAFTVGLGVYFTYLQLGEYASTSFGINDSVYGSVFFISTGFHGLHVIIGTRFLLICRIRAIYDHFSKDHHFGFEAAVWYWHFVDVVWIFLFISVYWWGGKS